MEFLDTVYWDNSVRAWLIAAGVALGIVLLVRVAVFVLAARVAKLATRTQTSVDDTIIKVLGSTKTLLALLVAIYVGGLFLVLPVDASRYLRIAAIIACLLQIGVWASTALAAAAVRLREK